MADVFTASLSNMDMIRTQFTIASHNIANAQDKDYAALKLNVAPDVVNGYTQGVYVSSVSVNVDEVLEGKLLQNIARESYDSTTSKYMTTIADYFGKPGSTEGLDQRINAVFTALDNLSRNPSSSSNKQIAVIELDNLSTAISDIAKKLETLRFDADNNIASSIGELNTDINNIHYALGTMYSAEQGSIEYITTYEKTRVLLEDMARYFELYQYRDEVGHYKIYTLQGDSLISDVKYNLKYSPNGTLDEMINDAPLNPITITAFDKAGHDMHLDKVIVQGGITSNIINRYSSGKIGALIDVRDKLIPNTLDQLDNLAVNIKNEFNKIHNEFTGYLPPSTLTGTTLVSRNETLGFDGKVRIAVLDDSGVSINNMQPLELDLSSLDTGSGPGKANLAGIINEINYHFGERLYAEKSIALGNLSDIKLASTQSTLDPSSTFILDLELENFSNLPSTITIQSVTAIDNSSNNILGSFDNSSFIAASGSKTRTTASGPSITLNTPASLSYPFTVTMKVDVNDGTSTYTADLIYTIASYSTTDINGLMNHRYSVTAKVNPADPGVINNPAFSTPAVLASLSAVDGSTLSINDLSQGLLTLTSQNKVYRVAIDSLNSAHKGDLGNNILPTNYGFSYFFGLNDLFIRKDSAANWGNTKNTAVWLDLRNDIKNDSGYLAKGKLKEIIDPINSTSRTYRYETTEGDNAALLSILDLTRKNVYFPPAVSIGSGEMTLSNYANIIISFAVNRANEFENRATQTNIMKTAIEDKLHNIRGVDVNEEMANIITYQQSFSASAKAIQTAKELIDTLLQVI